MNRYPRIILALFTMLFAAGVASQLQAATVRVGLSARETYVGAPVMLQIQVANAKSVDPPTIPTIDGLTAKYLGNPSQSTQITTINGRTTTTTTRVYSFELTPLRSGTFQIPAVAVNVDGATQQTRAVEFVATKSETGDLMFVEIAGKEKQIFVGQALHVTLKIWLRPYSDATKKIILSEADMWKVISERSEWGPFNERMQLYADQNRRPSGSEVLRKDRDGVEHSYYLYEIEATIYPKRPGKIDGDSVKIIADYPTALGRARDPFAGFFDDMPIPGGRPGDFGDDNFSLFGSRLVVQSSRPVVAQAVVEPIDVQPIPTAGRPSDYRGAVGTYHIAVDAKPTHVKAGDPINLFIGISGTGPMELVQAPPLADIPELNANFKVPSEPLAGFVKGDRKIFSTSIRPRKQGITQIPPIPFSFFDPAAGKFVTAHSDPISIQVDQAEVLALDQAPHVTDDSGSASHTSDKPAADSAHTSLAVVGGDDLLVNESPWSPNLTFWLILFAAAPVTALSLVIVRTRTGLFNLAHWFNSPLTRLQRELVQADSPSQIAAALKQFAAKYFKGAGSAGDALSIVGAMRASNERDLATRFEAFINDCDSDFNSVPTQSSNLLVTLKQRAERWANDAHSASLQARPKRNPRSGAKTGVLQRPAAATQATLMVAVLAASFASLAAYPVAAQETPIATVSPTLVSASATLTDQQQRQLLSEATAAYVTALGQLEQDPSSAKSGFEHAADKFQLLTNAGVANSRLFFNLANAQLESGQASKAIANYHRALRIDPTFRAAQTNLNQAEQQLHSASTETPQQSPNAAASQFLPIVSRWLSQAVTPRQLLSATALVWFAFWAVIACRMVGLNFPWKSSAFVLASVTVALAVSLIQVWPNSSQRLAIVVHSGPGNTTSPASEIGEGQKVEVLQQRPDTVRVRTPQGQELWLPTDSVDVI